MSGWLVRGDSWVESPPRAGYPLDDAMCATSAQTQWALRYPNDVALVSAEPPR